MALNWFSMEKFRDIDRDRIQKLRQEFEYELFGVKEGVREHNDIVTPRARNISPSMYRVYWEAV